MSNETTNLETLLSLIKQAPLSDNDSILDKDSLPEEALKQTWEERLNDEEIRDRQQNRAQRKEYADNIFTFLCIYMLFVGLIITGVGNSHCGFELSDTGLIALITTTTANVIGIFVFVVKYLFNPKH